MNENINLTALVHPPKPGIDTDHTPRYITIKGEKYVVSSIVHCWNKKQSDVRYWFPLRRPFEETIYVYSIIHYKDMTSSQRSRFFSRSNRRKIWRDA
jgi:hypothetical protein